MTTLYGKFTEKAEYASVTPRIFPVLIDSDGRMWVMDIHGDRLNVVLRPTTTEYMYELTTKATPLTPPSLGSLER